MRRQEVTSVCRTPSRLSLYRPRDPARRGTAAGTKHRFGHHDAPCCDQTFLRINGCEHAPQHRPEMRDTRELRPPPRWRNSDNSESNPKTGLTQFSAENSPNAGLSLQVRAMLRRVQYPATRQGRFHVRPRDPAVFRGKLGEM